MISLGEALPKEIARVRDRVLPHYIELGPVGAFATAMIRNELDMATRALAEGDLVEMIRMYQELKEIHA